MSKQSNKAKEILGKIVCLFAISYTILSLSSILKDFSKFDLTVISLITTASYLMAEYLFSKKAAKKQEQTA